ncbi:hypothetical protein BABINDRAFT_170048 [Babjeviella inositovora NRRL Y-12698]|uniref:Peroxin-7 n=1 Tax=Babjeviella inositovora NRRL Y-12698 TaxID=984486 RepID=A0A1E3QZ46_9ASCO|nr:uncharacterized protein BABINDRAFT_170048 [Babjeviella inositovora NRRL Y-12698]ODQ82943.1 hypothetical protein BABINDRAFT_170048 [Babjeviella inositovora NRRL Y-12698]
MLSFRTTGYNGYGVKYSPFYDNKLAVATAANYGLVGNGRLYILSINNDGSISSDTHYDTQDGLFDIAWSETHENQCVAASGDGSIKLFDVQVGQFPVMNWHEHQREVFSVNWNMVDKTNFVSASWDGSIKIWLPNRQQSLLTLSPEVDYTTMASPVAATAKGPAVPLSNKTTTNTTQTCIYQAVFSPHSPSVVVSAHANSHVMIWDLRAPHPLQLDYVAHGGLETLTIDWNKYRSAVIASSGVDKSVKVWDTRMIESVQPSASAPMPSFHNASPAPLNQFMGHEFAVRRISWSPHDGASLLSCSYDMSCRVWQDHMDDKARFLGARRMGPLQCTGVFGNHREFVIGCDWSMWGEPGWCVSTGWDEMVYVWDTPNKQA